MTGPGPDDGPGWGDSTEDHRLARRGARHPTFLTSLPKPLRVAIFDQTTMSMRKRGTELRVRGARAQEAHFIFAGCVAERVQSSQVNILRFHQTGTMIGGDDLALPPGIEPFTELDLPLLHTRVTCLTTTQVRSIPMARMRALAEAEPRVYRALLTSQVQKSVELQHVYQNFRGSIIGRVANLLLHLAERNFLAGVDGIQSWIVAGPSQSEIAEALMLSRASVENALRELRSGRMITTSSRRYVITDPTRLGEVSGRPFRSFAG
ncbi:Crp/Fnr family transcriptional regulator [Streptomyces sp. SL13]|uniref:Crp/Fnr family transcriptional regulator n=1 Tax=Streptantibioticus silvisoli TaxID=2705255 RepID=A0AA90KBQ2_9ACTN|nr:Crp/Fnr family transcriptional regulator [Streptantibioticus silvisoli]MDI5967431.1 Crp/Fnr family transcriptional regulator [Streptantibioticus silvisoli]MDI5973632.1 Crp/Fnr family transcriptional regulator [Streptantibioticus silvisoli]